MINLLSPQQKKQVRKLYRMRVTAIVLWLAVGLVLVMTGFLVPSYLLSTAKERSVIQEREMLEKEYAIEGVEDFEAEIEAINTHISYFPDGTQIGQQLSGHVIRPVIASMPGAISARTIAYQHAGTEHVVEVSGIAPSRDAVLAFVQALERVSHFQQVELPVQNLAPNENIAFRIEFITTTEGEEEQ